MASLPVKRCGLIFCIPTFFYVLMSNNKMDIFTKIVWRLHKNTKIQNSEHTSFTLHSFLPKIYHVKSYFFSLQNSRDKNSGVGNQTPRRGEASFHISLLMAGMENASHKNAMDQLLWPKILKLGFLVKLDAGATKHFFSFLAKNWMLGGGNWSNLISTTRNHQLDSLWWWRDDERMVCHP